MFKKILVCSLLATSLEAFSDYYSDSNGSLISETNIEQELRETTECLSKAGGDVQNCDLYYAKEIFPRGGDGEISSAFSGDISSSEDILSEDRSISSLSKIYARYSGAEGSASLPAEFEHTQSCEYLKSLIEGEFADENNPTHPATLPSNDTTGMAFNKNAYYSCEGSEGLGIKASSVNGTAQVTIGTENVVVPVDVDCYGKQFNFNGGFHMVSECGKYGEFQFNFNGRGSTNSPLDTCTNLAHKKNFNCTIHLSQTWDYEYKRFYQVVASPLTLDANSQSGVVDDIEYQVTINYIYQKQRTLPVEQWAKGWVPIQVGGITTFILAPVKPSYPISSFTTNVIDRVYRSVTAKNNAELTLGCGAKSSTLDMTNKSDRLILESFDIANLITNCSEFSVSIDNLKPINGSNVYWTVEYEWSPEEALVWDKYAVFLQEKISDSLISSAYINQLRNATNESTNDSQLIIKTLTEYIIGHNVDPVNFVFTPSGLWAFLLAEGSDFDINSDAEILAEIESLVERHGSYGDIIFNFNSRGEVVKSSIESSENVRPIYWRAFARSHYAKNINFLDKYNLLKQAKNIIEVSDASGDTSTLQVQMDLVANAAEFTRFYTIDKVERFLESISTRSDIEESLCNELNTLRSELNINTEVCAN